MTNGFSSLTSALVQAMCYGVFRFTSNGNIEIIESVTPDDPAGMDLS